MASKYIYFRYPSNVNPRSLQLVCNNTSMKTYYQGPSGVVYYGTNYVPLGLGTRWYRTTSGTFVKFNRGLIIAFYITLLKNKLWQ
jgi:hypothetical protein